MKFIKDFKEFTTANLNTITGDSSKDDGILANKDTLLEPVPSGKIIDVLQMPWYAGKTASSSRLNKIPRGYIVERKQKLNSLLSGALESDKSLLQKNNLNSLLGIYLTEETGFKYALPYLNGPIGVNSNWGDEGSGALNGLINAGMSIIDEISKITNVTQPGVYIQKPKYFNFEQEGKSVSFNFPLLNTVTNDKAFDYKSNYELLWLLTYQNKPFKTSFARTTPGKIYTVEIPGVVSMPYAYISEMSIDFRGTIRQLPVDTPKKYNAPIPEAYVVNITFTSLITDFANTMQGSGFTSTIEENKVSFKF